MRKTASSGSMFHLRRINFHQYVRRTNNGTIPLLNGNATTSSEGDQCDIEDGPEPIKDKMEKNRATMILLDKGTRIGRNPELVDVVLHSVHHSNMISRDHSEVIAETDKNGKYVGYYIKDKSLNGTYVNDIRVEGAHHLKEGDTIKFGHINGAAIRPGQTAPQMESEFIFKFERALPDYSYCGFSDSRVRLYPDLKKAYLQIYSDRAEPELIQIDKNPAGNANLLAAVPPPTTSAAKITSKPSAQVTALKAPTQLSSPSSVNSALPVRPTAINAATSLSNHLAQQPLGAHMPTNPLIDEVTAAAYALQLSRLQQQQQNQRYYNDALAAYLSQNPSYAASLWPWAARSGLQPTDWNQLSQQAAAAAYPSSVAAVAALQQHLHVPPFGNRYAIPGVTTTATSSITGAVSSFGLPSAAAAMASAFSLAPSCYVNSMGCTPSASSSGTAVYSTSTTPASTSKIPTLFGGGSLGNTSVGSIPNLAAVLPALAARSSNASSLACNDAMGGNIPITQSLPLPNTLPGVSSSIPSVGQPVKVPQTNGVTPVGADFGKTTPEGKAPQDPHPNPSAQVDTPVSVVAPKSPTQSLASNTLSGDALTDVKPTSSDLQSNGDYSRPTISVEASGVVKLANHNSKAEETALKREIASPLASVVGSAHSTSSFNRSAESSGSDSGIVIKCDEYGSVPTPPKPLRREEGGRSPALSNPSRPCSLQSIPQSPPRAPRPQTMESRSPSASRSPVERNFTEQEKRPPSTKINNEMDKVSGEKEVEKSTKGTQAKAIKHFRKSNEVARLLNDLTEGSWMHQAARGNQRTQKTEKKKAQRKDRGKAESQKNKTHKMMRQISDESSDEENSTKKEGESSGDGLSSSDESLGPVGSHSSKSRRKSSVASLTNRTGTSASAAVSGADKTTAPQKPSTSASADDSTPKSRHATFKSSILQKHRANNNSNGNGTSATLVASPSSPMSSFPSSPVSTLPGTQHPLMSNSPPSAAGNDSKLTTKMSTQARRRMLRESAEEEQRQKLLLRKQQEERKKKGKKTPGRKRRLPTPEGTVRRRSSESDESESDNESPVRKRLSSASLTAKSSQKTGKSSSRAVSVAKERKRKSTANGRNSDSSATESDSDNRIPKKQAKLSKKVSKPLEPQITEDDDDWKFHDAGDRCAHKKCRRPHYENINWVQCDDCDEWYHNMCVFGEEKSIDEDEFHCGCDMNGKRKKKKLSV